MLRICQACCLKFEPHVKKKANQKYCSQKCNAYYNRRINSQQHPHFTVIKKIICKSCEKQFNQRAGIYHEYCSDECLSKNKKEKSVCELKKCNCQLCESIFTTKNNLTAKYCSDKCRSLARYRKMTGYPVKSPRVRSQYGNGYVNKCGYRAIYRDHPNANSRTKIILEHVFVMSEMIGRPIRKGETVHHKNGVRHDNRPENLELWTSRHPAGVRKEDKIKSCIAFLEEEGYKIILPE